LVESFDGDFSFGYFSPWALTVAGTNLYLEGLTGEIWQSGGTPETTHVVVDNSLPSPWDNSSGFSSGSLAPWSNYNYGNADIYSNAAEYSQFAAIGSSLYFSTGTPSPRSVSGGQLYRLNNPPVANADAYTSVQNSTLTTSAAAGVLANDTDPDAADAGHLTAALVSGPTHGTLAFNADGSFTYTPNAGYVGPDSFTYQASDGFDPSNVATVSLTVGSLQNALDGLSTGGQLTVQTTTPQQAHDLIAAADALDPATTPTSTLVVDLGGQTIQDTIVSVPSQVTIQFINGTFIGGSPALIVNSGTVIVKNSTFLNATDAPTILVTGGSLTLRGDTIQESPGYSDAAIEVTGGKVDLGTATDPGGNTININGSGTFVTNTTAIPIASSGTAFTVNGAALAPDSLSGIVFKDFNDDSQVDFGEQGIAGVAVALTGTDFLGNAVSMSATTDSDGVYIFANLQPGTYSITETQPAGYTQGIDTVGTAGGNLTATDKFFVSLTQDTIGLNGLNYNFGEQPQATGSVQKGQTAGIGFWNNKNGQALINSFNGGATSTQLAAWLAATLPHIFGVDAGSNALIHADGSYFTNTEVAARFQQDFVLKGVKLDAQVLATALSVYATNATLDDTGVAANYGFLVSGDGVGTAGVNVGSNGDAFGVANNTVLTVLDLLKATDALAVDGLL
jgi:VCBS repeat-containing protein